MKPSKWSLGAKKKFLKFKKTLAFVPGLWYHTIRGGQQKGENKMYTVWTFDDATCDDMMVFEGTLAQCIDYVGDDEDDEFYIVEHDGFTVVE
jgi:hypothetical protein